MALLNDMAVSLRTGGIASSSGSGTGWYLYLGLMPDSTRLADRAVALTERGGKPQLVPVDIDQPQFRAIIRGARMTQVSTAYKEAKVRAQMLRDWLHFRQGTINGTVYASIQATDEPVYQGEDSEQRPVFALDFQAWKESS